LQIKYHYLDNDFQKFETNEIDSDKAIQNDIQIIENDLDIQKNQINRLSNGIFEVYLSKISNISI
jgi:hypothetical protein